MAKVRDETSAGAGRDSEQLLEQERARAADELAEARDGFEAERSRLETELAAARRRLEEMELAVADAQQNAEQARTEARERGEMSRAERFRAAAERIGGVAEQVDAAAERASRTSITDAAAPPEAAEGVGVPETPEPEGTGPAPAESDGAVDQEPVDEDAGETAIFDIESDAELTTEVEAEQDEDGPSTEADLEPADFVKEPDPDRRRRSEAITGVWAVPADAADVGESERGAEVEAEEEFEDGDAEEAELVDEDEDEDDVFDQEPDAAPALDHGERISLANANFEQLRSIGMSVTQAKRVLRHRDERGLRGVESLEQVPGFPRSFLDGLDARLTD